MKREWCGSGMPQAGLGNVEYPKCGLTRAKIACKGRQSWVGRFCRAVPISLAGW